MENENIIIKDSKTYLSKTTISNIIERCNSGYIRKSAHPTFPNLVIFNYTDKCSFDEAWDDYTRMCRGLVVDMESGEVIIWCIPKFFNQGEKFADKVDFSNFSTITLKEDGYMIQYTYHEKYGLIVTSRGSFDSQYANYVYSFLKNKVTQPIMFLGNRVSFMLELCKDFPGDENIIVTKHPEEKLVCWAATDTFGLELGYHEISPLLPEGISLVQSFSVEEAKKYLTEEVEGNVIKGGLSFGGLQNAHTRVKVKTNWFLKIHRLISNCTKRRVLELVKEGGRVGDLEGLPDEFMKQMLEWEKEIHTKIDKMVKESHSLVKQYESWTDKDLGVKQPERPFAMAILFMLRKGKEQKAIDSIIKYVGDHLGDDLE